MFKSDYSKQTVIMQTAVSKRETYQFVYVKFEGQTTIVVKTKDVFYVLKWHYVQTTVLR